QAKKQGDAKRPKLAGGPAGNKEAQKGQLRYPRGDACRSHSLDWRLRRFRLSRKLYAEIVHRTIAPSCRRTIAPSCRRTVAPSHRRTVLGLWGDGIGP